MKLIKEDLRKSLKAKLTENGEELKLKGIEPVKLLQLFELIIDENANLERDNSDSQRKAANRLHARAVELFKHNES